MQRRSGLPPPRDLSASLIEVDGKQLLVLEYAAGDALSANETQVIACVLKGMTNAAIARQLGMSRGTIANRVRSAFRKLGVTTRGELAAHYANGR